MALKVDIQKKLGAFTLDVRFETQEGALGILGASGSGKSMTLRCIAGIERPDAGHIELDGETLFDSAAGVDLPPRRRRVGYLFQSYALFPHMTVRQNIACGMPRGGKGQQGAIEELLARFDLQPLQNQHPGRLSGGQQQRVALARILASKPKALLLDEPFSALDTHLREQLQLDMMELLHSYGSNVVMVTHSRDEVYKMCPRLLVLHTGRSLAEGDTKALFNAPGQLEVARLTGCKNLAAAKQTGKNQVQVPAWGVTLTVAGPIPQNLSHVGVRAHDFFAAEQNTPNAIPVKAEQRMEAPFEWNVLFRNAGMESAGDLWWKLEKRSQPLEMPAYLAVDPASVLLLYSAPGEDGV